MKPDHARAGMSTRARVWIGLVAVCVFFIGAASIPVGMLFSVRSDLLSYNDQLNNEAEVIERLGGQKAAASKIRFMISLGDWATGDSSKLPDLLIACGECGVPVLIRLLDHRDSFTRYAAAQSLKGFEDKARAAIPRLLEMADAPDGDPVFSTRTAALVTLVSIDPNRPEVKKRLISALRGRDVGIRCRVAYALAEAKNLDRDLIENLSKKAQAKRRDAACAAAAYAYWRHGGDTASVLTNLRRILLQPSSNDRCEALAALLRIRKGTPEIVDAVGQMALNEKDSAMRRAAVGLLSVVGDVSCQSWLEKVVAQDDSATVSLAKGALEKIKKAQQEKQAKDKQPVETPAKPD